ncbi:phage portal protein [uncultured Deefgea sp.]|uniref:phage portal protein n=1 Tax=uncultured Deefgea sp. TaxID=1304914 RepID=UPI0026211100|nr:phage portal protein [uncultured Deefgea sp.]
MQTGSKHRSLSQQLRINASSHTGASMTTPQMASWMPVAGSADADLLPELGTLVARSRDISRNNGIAASGVQTLVDNVVGTGLRLSALPDWKTLGKDAAWALAWQRNVETLWREWTKSTFCDAGLSLNFAGLTELMFRSQLLNGDAIALPLWLKRPGSRFTTTFQLIEADRLCNPNGQPDSATLRGGIEFDTYGAPQAYWIRKTHPGDYIGIAGSVAGEWERIPARTSWGRPRIIHLFDKERAGQARGKPLISSVLQQFRQLDKYNGAELDAAVINAMMAAFIETPMDSEGLLEMFGGSDGVNDVMAKRNQSRAKLKSGSIIPLYPGEKMAPFMPARPAAQFEAFTVAVMRQIAASMGLPYELLLKDFSKTNYSSARAALLEAWRCFRSRREKLADYWAQVVYELWLEEVINAGKVEGADFYQQRAAYTRSKWIGPGRGWVDPLKEIQAADVRLKSGISTLEAECAEQGSDWEEVLEQQAREKAKRAELGLPDPMHPEIPIVLDDVVTEEDAVPSVVEEAADA